MNGQVFWSSSCHGIQRGAFLAKLAILAAAPVDV